MAKLKAFRLVDSKIKVCECYYFPQMYMYVYIYIYICVCVCVFLYIFFCRVAIFMCESKKQFSNSETLSHKHVILKWMKKLENNMLLSAISIPGTHQSSRYLRTRTPMFQAWGLHNQLDAGVRFFDLHVSSDSIKYESGSVQESETLIYFLKTMQTFLVKQKKETLLLRVTPDESSVPLVTELLSGGKWPVWRDKEIPTLGQARGKIVLIKSSTLELGIPVHITELNADMNTKETQMRENIKLASQKCEQEMMLSYTGATGESEEPLKIAETLNKQVDDYLLDLKGDTNRPHCVGIIAMDFPGPKLIQTIINFNGKLGEGSQIVGNSGSNEDVALPDTSAQDKSQSAGGGETTSQDKSQSAGGGETSSQDKSQSAGGGETSSHEESQSAGGGETSSHKESQNFITRRISICWRWRNFITRRISICWRWRNFITRRISICWRWRNFITRRISICWRWRNYITRRISICWRWRNFITRRISICWRWRNYITRRISICWRWRNFITRRISICWRWRNYITRRISICWRWRTTSHEESQSAGGGETSSHEESQSAGGGETTSHEESQSAGGGETSSHEESQSAGGGETSSHEESQSAGGGETSSHEESQSAGGGETTSHEESQSAGGGETTSHEESQSAGGGETTSHEESQSAGGGETPKQESHSLGEEHHTQHIGHPRKIIKKVNCHKVHARPQASPLL